MGNIFDNMNTKVQIFSTGIKEDVFKKNPYLIAREGYEKILEKKKNEELIKQNEEKEKLSKQNKLIENINSIKLTESIIDRLHNKLYNESKTMLFKDIIFELFCKSLYLDDDFIIENSVNLKNFSDSYIDERGGFTLLENAIKRTNSYLLKSIKNVCESTAKKICERKIKESKENNNHNDMVFDINDDEQKQFDYEKKNFNFDELAELVKKNVLTVVQDEKERQTKEKELYAEIENELEEDENIKTEKDVKEALNRMIIKNSLIEETTLFNALLRNSYKDIIESVVLKCNDAQLQKDKIKTKPNLSEDELDEINDVEDEVNVYIDEYDKQHNIDDGDDNENNEDYDDEYDDDEDDNENDEDDDDEDDDENNEYDDGEDDNINIEMDLVLAEAITKYTIMEISHTIKLESFKPLEVKNIIYNLIK